RAPNHIDRSEGQGRMSCTDCGRKGGCDHRKQALFTALDETLARLYPTRRWDERDDGAALAAPDAAASADGEVLAAAIAQRLQSLALFVPGGADEWCDYVYVLCLGRTPSLVELREGLAEPAPDEDGIDERYLRVSLSALGRFAGVQEVAMALDRSSDQLAITERTRKGVFDPVLLPRFQKLVAVLVEHDVRDLDFGE